MARGSPVCTENTGRMSPASAASPTAAAAQRQRTTPRAQPDQRRLGDGVMCLRGQSNRRPAVASRIGSSVSATAAETSGISSPAYARPCRNGTGRASSASRPALTTSPDSSTDRPALAIAAWTAATGSWPRPRCSRHRVTTSSE